MSDNTLQQENKSIATEDIGGHQIQRVKAIIGPPGVDGGNISDVNQMPVIPWRDLVALGLVPGHQWVNITGTNPDIDTGADETIWNAGGIFVFPPAAELFTVTSDDPNDTLLGSGAQTVRLTGLDGDHNAQIEDLDMDGLGGVTSTLPFIHIQRVDVLTAGVTEENEGEISVIGVDSSLLVALFNAGVNNSSLSHYIVPAGKTAYIYQVALSAHRTANTTASFTLKVKAPPSVLFHTEQIMGTGPGSFLHVLGAPLPIPEKSQLLIFANVTANNTACSVSYELMLVDN